MRTVYLSLVLVFSIVIVEKAVGFDTASDIFLEAGTQQRALIDIRHKFNSSDVHTLFGNIRGGVGSTSSDYTPHSNHPFFEGDFGFGYRYRSLSLGLGGYAFYSILHTPYEHNFSRGTLGAECLYNSFKTFVNFYLPLGDKTKLIDSKFNFNEKEIELSNHQAELIKSSQSEVLPSFGAEFNLGKESKYIDVNASFLYFASTDGTSDRYGGYLDLKVKPNRLFGLKLHSGYDSFYKRQIWGGITIPFGPKDESLCKKRRYLNYIPLNEFFWTQRKKEVVSKELIANNIFYVNNSLTYPPGFLGTGTFETPFLNAQLAVDAITNIPDATVYFYKGATAYTNFNTFNLIGSQRLTGQGGPFRVGNQLLLNGSNVNRPILSRSLLQESLNTPLITVANNGENIIENIGLNNLSGNVATGGSMITLAGTNFRSLNIRNITSTEKVSLFMTDGSQILRLSRNDIVGVDLKTFGSALLSFYATKNVFRTNRMVADRFGQPIGACLFLESLDNSQLFTQQLNNNLAIHSLLNGNAHLGYGFLSSNSSTNTAVNGVIANEFSGGPMPPNNAGAFLYQGVDSSRVVVQGCFDNLAVGLLDDIVLQNCDIDIKKAGFSPDPAGLSAANNGIPVSPFASVSITNSE